MSFTATFVLKVLEAGLEKSTAAKLDPTESLREKRREFEVNEGEHTAPVDEINGIAVAECTFQGAELLAKTNSPALMPTIATECPSGPRKTPVPVCNERAFSSTAIAFVSKCIQCSDAAMPESLSATARSDEIPHVEQPAGSATKKARTIG